VTFCLLLSGSAACLKLSLCGSCCTYLSARWQRKMGALALTAVLCVASDCRAGLLDGPVSLVASLLAFGGSSAASLEVQQAGLVSAVLSTATSGRDSPVLELSPTGECVCLCTLLAGIRGCAGKCRKAGAAFVAWACSRCCKRHVCTKTDGNR
jgi:hypothetical protein